MLGCGVQEEVLNLLEEKRGRFRITAGRFFDYADRRIRGS
jgi:hypothetical protein